MNEDAGTSIAPKLRIRVRSQQHLEPRAESSFKQFTTAKKLASTKLAAEEIGDDHALPASPCGVAKHTTDSPNLARKQSLNSGSALSHRRYKMVVKMWSSRT
jgi:hypothetical protein